MKFEELQADRRLKAPNGREFYVIAKAPGFVDMAHIASGKQYSFNKDTYEEYFEIKGYLRRIF